MNGTIDTDIIDHAGANYPALNQLLAGYFHEDWQEDHASPAAAVQAFLREASPATVEAAAREIDRLLGLGLDDAALTQVLIEGLDCNYVAETDGLTSIAWLTGVRDRLGGATA
jgi:hypothetical protein